MATQKFVTRNMMGLSQAIDPTVSDQIFALNGRNYVFDSKGPRSVFGNRLLLPQPRTRPQHIQGARIRIRGQDRCFTFDGDGIWEWDESRGGFVAVFATPDTTLSPHRWTYGYLNGYLYLAHPRVGLLAYDIDTRICLPHALIGLATPEEVIAITVNNGRLIVVGPSLFSWSEPSNGLSFVPTLGGGGFQVIADRVPGSPIMVSDYGRGTLTWTSGGVMRSEFTGDAAVYRHRSVNTDYRPINSFCSARLEDDTIVILDERGLFRSRGEGMEPYSPLFNEFLGSYLQINNLKVGTNVRLEWDELQQFLYLSYSLSYADPLFESAFVYYPPLDKWGTFNEPHYGILPLLISDSSRADDYYGFADPDGCIRYWQSVGSREAPSRDSLTKRPANLYQPVTPRSIQYEDNDTGIIMPAFGHASGFSRVGITQPAAYYLGDATTPITPELIGLDSKLQFGLFRPTGQTASDEVSEVLNVLVRSVESGPSERTSIDYNLIAPATEDEDYNLVSGSEDYGFEELNYVNHGLRIIGTLDGVTESQSEVPSLVSFVKGARYYSCSVIGVWHIGEVTADAVGESFHIQTFEITAAPAGRLM